MPMQTRGSTEPSDSTGSAKRKPVRRDPEKRRQQNIQAQKKYREKLRKRLENLEALAASAAQNHAVERTAAVEIDASEAAVAHGPSTFLPHIAANGIPASEAPRIPVPFPSAVIPRDPCPSLEDFSAALPLWEPSTYVTNPDCTSSSLSEFDPTIYAPLSDNLSVPSIWDASVEASLSDDFSSAPSLRDFTTSVPQSDKPASALSIVGTESQSKPSFLLPDNHGDNTGASNCIIAVKCRCPKSHIRVQTQSPYPFRSGEIRIVTLEAGAPAADPYANHIRIDPVCTVTALYTLGIQIGVNESMLCADESFSPFYRPSASSANDLVKANMVGTVQRIFKTLKPDLRPNREQIMIEHHPYIDILPFPTLRRNLLLRQADLDEDEFMDDIISGLVCWGGAGMGKRDRQVSVGRHPTGTPWDVRSWEAKVWFLKKYWALLGGEDGELVRQSEWWRGLRGEDEEVFDQGDSTPEDSPLFYTTLGI
ncbi:bZIP transcription factor [Aspergillus brunneoviolaceus CBS 621.78]|uniref:Uncharacterized protein n=1 Tax=Aspergillus brunneoviolaceus CBS 621.78 TaxID=1450534 RepID=A0ACD1GLB6_9EURO|nr:hypothetical protein BO95DRAFT_449785 [Aspergillus brunneoviolaceus CBS 621.78]RAH50030.1 hypothetical protein BO95DRAFT_449785 [Aspergillus brunneoviolaceus CBS 621.78]